VSLRGRATSPSVNPSHTVAQISVPIAGTGPNQASNHAVEILRTRVIPATVGSLAGVHAYVTGQTDQSIDFSNNAASHAPIVLAFVLALAFLLLLSTFRSLVVAVKAILLNLLSVGAACGLLVLVIKLLGDWNWYLPRWLDWLPKLALDKNHDVRTVFDAPRPRPQRGSAVTSTSR
jgi:predicted RND superfamily exporter protein